MRQGGPIELAAPEPGGRLLNHALGSVRAFPTGGARCSGFIDQYIFPDGETIPLSAMLDALEHADLELRDSETLRGHYGRTLRAWTANLRRTGRTPSGRSMP